ncbi:Serine-threonine/tyrosine-protein kinase catalytic domain [Arabidopsis suecica]|uniref:non-specific serine/threonine protein kinase n=1 Tax=Arabidopsis suecica TaxID=45249 RepID=A0A8T2B7C4_ARASU|nr:Serine-threonine/tyrosine-protein kinase catalytic domain [Arabidopsis suecica]
MLTWETPVMLASNTASTKKLAFITTFLIIVLCPVTMVMSQPQADVVPLPGSDADCLLRFKDTLVNASFISSWDPSISPCKRNSENWFGVLCVTGNVWGLQLEGMGLTGKLDLEPLAPIKNLRTLSFMNNKFNGSMPSVKNLGALKSLYLSNNRFTGEIPADAFDGMHHLKKLLLANNAFRGNIPSSLASLPMLLELRVNGNQFHGQIPDFKQKDLKLASFENNDLEGPIPGSLSNMDPVSFSGNKNLCGPPLSPCSSDSGSSPDLPSSPTEKNKNQSFFTIAIVLSVIGIILMIISLVVCILDTRKRKSLSAYPSAGQDRTEKYNYDQSTDKDKAADSVTSYTSRRGAVPDQNKLLFLQDDIQRFDLQDLLRASAEVLGSGSFGASYKTGINSGQTLVVKRYKHMNNVGREEFHDHMRRLGRLNHPNLLPIVAYYYRREEKLLIAEFMPNRSLASHLHANHSVDQPGLDWPTRVKIIQGVAKGLGYLFNELTTLTIPHGHLKSSNVVLDESFEPLLTDYALRPVMNSEQSHNLMISYKSPEYSLKGHLTKKTDVWCLGVLILELLTGRFPENYLSQGYDANMSLVTWVSNMVKEKKTGDVFDKEMTGKKNCKAEMLNLLKIGLSCCEEDEERRMEMRDAVEKIERLKEGEFDNDFASTTHNVFASRLIDDDDFGFAMNR